MSLGTRSGVHWMRRKVRSSDRATARGRVVFPTPGTSSSRTSPSTRRAPRSCSVTSRFPTTTAPTCSTSRSAAPRTVRLTRELCGLQFRDGGSARRGPAANDARGDERDREADEGAHRMQSKHDRILLAHRERRERSLDEEDEGDADERAQRNLRAVHGTRRDGERDRREDVDDPTRALAGRGPGLSARHVALVDAVRDEREGQRQRHPADEPPVPPRDRAAPAICRFRVAFRLRAGGARALEREECVDVRRLITEAPDTERGNKDEELDAGGREVRDDRFDRLWSERERGDRTLDQKKHRKADPRL